ncbi:hypothetical protein N7452_002874 [Penicillium brevicompactum]|uniref:Uncharacterized protein n=1 Tax=Penicillium brevicompactum TaxID=5074 RepID=A0A9W9QSG5_PENBR|nr:hypothetical protein N7452_002874 [Penicillium brevicompactum]
MADGGEARRTATHSVSSVCSARQVHIPSPRPRRPRTGVRNAETDKFMRDPQWTFENTVEQSHSSVFVVVIAAVA